MHSTLLHCSFHATDHMSTIHCQLLITDLLQTVIDDEGALTSTDLHKSQFIFVIIIYLFLFKIMIGERLSTCHLRNLFYFDVESSQPWEATFIYNCLSGELLLVSSLCIFKVPYKQFAQSPRMKLQSSFKVKILQLQQYQMNCRR